MSTVDFVSRVGFVEAKLSDADLAPIWDEVKKVQQRIVTANTMNHLLAGQIEQAYELTECQAHLEKLLLPYIAEFDNEYHYLERKALLTKDAPIILYQSWVNFQKKYEYNPVHRHSGLFSFTIWLQIPYTREEEAAVNPGALSPWKDASGEFNFYHTDGLGNIITHPVKCDKSRENTLLLFPAEVNHSVHPFYSSDEFRITVAGNFRIKV
jgi:hypothetical protein